MIRREWLQVTIFTCAFAAMGIFCWLRFSMSTEITHFLPRGGDTRGAELTKALADSELTRTMILSIGADDPESAAAGAGELAALLRQDARFAWVRSSPEIDESAGKAVFDLYFPRRMMLLSDKPEVELPARFSAAGLAAAADEVKRRLAGPTGTMIARIADADPLLAFPAQLERLHGLEGSSPLPTVGGNFMSLDGRHGIVFAASKASAFRSADQGPLLATIAQLFGKVNAAHGGSLVLEQSGVNRFAVAAEASMRSDISRISIVGTLGAVVLMLLVFRSPGYIVLLMIPVAAGMLTGLFVCLVVLGRVHAVTLGFGSTLIGVCIDYPIHFFNYYTLRPDPRGPRGSLERIWMSILLGAVTTVAGFAGMAATSFPGIREIALFAPAGIVAALAVTRYVLPALMPSSRPPSPSQRALVKVLARVFDGLVRSRRLLIGVPALAIVLSAIGLTRVRWSDDLNALNRFDPSIIDEDRRVRERVSNVDPGRVIAAIASDEETALCTNDAVYAKLVEAEHDGLLLHFRSAHAAIWSKDLQERNLAAVRAEPDLAARVMTAFAARGFKPNALARFASDLSAEIPPPLTLTDLEATPLGAALRLLHLSGPPGKPVGLLTLVQGVTDSAALQLRLADIPGAQYFDQGAYLREVYSRFRVRTLMLMVAGLVLVFVVVWLRYRKMRPSLAAFLPSVLASTSTIALLALLGVEQNLMSAIAILVVLSVGVDYGIFMVEARRRDDSLPVNLLSVVLACATTILSFGLLGISANPALRSIGLTTGLGCFLSLIFTPTTLLLLESPTPGRTPT
jgi:predicted exporter